VAKSQPVEIGGHRFERKTDALAFMKVMLNRYRPGDAVNADDDPTPQTLLGSVAPRSLGQGRWRVASGGGLWPALTARCARRCCR
jgi:hypothetical protein